MDAIAISLRSIAKHERDHMDRPELAKVIESAADDIERLRTAAKQAIKLIDTNLYHQREKVEDASQILKLALNPV